MTKRKTFSKEFKCEAVRLFEAGDKDGVSLAREGIRRITITPPPINTESW
jgi:transposase-like protein